MADQDVDYQRYSDDHGELMINNPTHQLPLSMVYGDVVVRVGDLGSVVIPNTTFLEEGYNKGEDDSDDDLSSIDENYDVISIASSIEDQLTWRGRMQLVLHSHRFHLMVISLVILDVIIVLFELLLDVGAFGNKICSGGNFLTQIEFCHFDPASRSMCAPSPRLVLQDLFLHSNDSQVACHCDFRGGREICIPRTDGRGINPAMVLHCASLGILTIFLLEVILKLIAFRLKYFTNKLEAFDGAVVIISWMLDLASLANEEAFEAASLLIVLRLWRIIRVINGSVVSAAVRADIKLHKAKYDTKKVVHAFHKAQNLLFELRKENSELKKLLSRAERKGEHISSRKEELESRSEHTEL